MAQLFSNVSNLNWQQAVMWLIGGILIYLAVKRDMEPALLLPMGFGAILVNLPLSGAVTQIINGVEEIGVLNVLFDAGIANELFPLLLFVGIGAMIDFEPLLNDPKLMFFGAAAQFGIFFTFSLAALLGFPIKDAAAIGIIGAADGPTAIFMANFLRSNYLGAIMVAAYSYMALVPIVQPPVIRLLTSQKERLIRMPYEQKSVGKTTRILFPILTTIVAGVVAPASVSFTPAFLQWSTTAFAQPGMVSKLMKYPPFGFVHSPIPRPPSSFSKMPSTVSNFGRMISACLRICSIMP